MIVSESTDPSVVVLSTGSTLAGMKQIAAAMTSAQVYWMEWWWRHRELSAAARAIARLGRIGRPRQQGAGFAGNESGLGGREWNGAHRINLMVSSPGQIFRRPFSIRRNSFSPRSTQCG